MLRRLGGVTLVAATTYLAADAAADSLLYLRIKRWALGVRSAGARAHVAPGLWKAHLCRGPAACSYVSQFRSCLAFFVVDHSSHPPNPSPSLCIACSLGPCPLHTCLPGLAAAWWRLKLRATSGSKPSWAPPSRQGPGTTAAWHSAATGTSPLSPCPCGAAGAHPT